MRADAVKKHIAGAMQVLRRSGGLLVSAFRLMVGVGDYEAYVTHMRQQHPDMPVLSREVWFRQRMEVRYGVSKDGLVKKCPC